MRNFFEVVVECEYEKQKRYYKNLIRHTVQRMNFIEKQLKNAKEI